MENNFIAVLQLIIEVILFSADHEKVVAAHPGLLHIGIAAGPSG
jgi:hypothetical protein